MKNWSLILEFNTENPAILRDRLLEELRAEGYVVRAKTILTSQLTVALKPPDPFGKMMPSGHVKHAHRTTRRPANLRVKRRRMSVWDDLNSAIQDAGDVGLGTYTADTGERVLEVWLDNRHFRVFVADVIEVNE